MLGPSQLALIVTDPPFAEMTEVPSWSALQLLESGAERKKCLTSRPELFTIVMAVVGAWALDSNGPPIIMPTKIASAESDVKEISTCAT